MNPCPLAGLAVLCHAVHMADKGWERWALWGSQSLGEQIGSLVGGLMWGAVAVGTVWAIWYLWIA